MALLFWVGSRNIFLLLPETSQLPYATATTSTWHWGWPATGAQGEVTSVPHTRQETDLWLQCGFGFFTSAGFSS